MVFRFSWCNHTPYFYESITSVWIYQLPQYNRFNTYCVRTCIKDVDTIIEAYLKWRWHTNQFRRQWFRVCSMWLNGFKWMRKSSQVILKCSSINKSIDSWLLSFHFFPLSLLWFPEFFLIIRSYFDDSAEHTHIRSHQSIWINPIITCICRLIHWIVNWKNRKDAETGMNSKEDVFGIIIRNRRYEI